MVVLAAILAGCSDMISDDTLKTQAPSVQIQPKKIKPQPKIKKQTGQKVALLLPLSGKEATLGQAMKNAAELSLFENADDHLELLVKDTKNTPEGAAVAAQAALDQGAQLILGPVFAQEVRAVLPYAQMRNVPVISFSSDRSVAGRGNYIMGFSPQEQIKRVVSFAKSKGIDRLVVLVPSTPYGLLVTSCLKELSEAGETTIVTAVTYTGGGEKLIDELKRINTLSFKGVLLPVGGENLKILLANMQAFGFDFSKVQLLGTGLWDTAEIQEIPLLVGAWYASVELLQRLPFEAHFRESYGTLPTRIATLAYDSVYLAAALSKNNPPRPFQKEMLTQPEGFKGIDGLFRLKSQGETERSLVILEITPQGTHVISPAENHF